MRKTSQIMRKEKIRFEVCSSLGVCRTSSDIKKEAVIVECSRKIKSVVDISSQCRMKPAKRERGVWWCRIRGLRKEYLEYLVATVVQ